MKRTTLSVVCALVVLSSFAQPIHEDKAEYFEQASLPEGEIPINRLHWLPASHQFWLDNKGSLYLYDAGDLTSNKLFLSDEQIKAARLKIRVEDIVWSSDQKSILVYTASARVWRQNTRGDYWYFDLATGKGKQFGKGKPPSSLMFAKFSPDGKNVAYVSKHNLYVENIATGKITPLTTDGTDRIINGTFDWVYEEELDCRDGFRWSPDSKTIAYWRVDARPTPNHLMINNTDSLYPFVIPVEYPKAGFKPSNVKIGVVSIATKKTLWLQIPGDPTNNYLPRMEWTNNGSEVMVMQLNRLQNEATLYLCNAITGKATKIHNDKDDAWVDVHEWTWIDDSKSFLWSSEKDGWLHIYQISKDGKSEKLLTKGAFDAQFEAYDAANKNLYFVASPYDATQKYLYRINLQGGDTVRVTPVVFDGSNTYTLSPDAAFATHMNASIKHEFNIRLVSLPDHKKIYPSVVDEFKTPKLNFSMEKFRVTTSDGVQMDGIMAKPLNFDSTKKYPVYFFAYGEPANTTAKDLPRFNSFFSRLIPEGAIGITLDNRGTPAFKGREWRKAIYKKIGVINSQDQAMAAKEILKWRFVDTSRIAIHGWSGGGAMTLNLLFRYPEIYKTGIAISAVTDQHFYDNIYTERYMGLPQDDEEAYHQSSPITFAKNLRGNLLYIHGTGDDNVHYKNAEVLLNELIKQEKLFQFMAYPNRTHGISEGAGTSEHLTATFLNYMREKCPPGAK